jgi:hypothetical protein
MKTIIHNEAVRQRGAIPRGVRRVLTASLSHCSIVFIVLALLMPASVRAQTQAVPVPIGTLLATQAVSNGAAIQFAGLTGNAAYVVQCHAIQVATSAVHLQIELGEGATPSWNTAASYFYANVITNSSNGTPTYFVGETGTAILLDWSSGVVGNNSNHLNTAKFWLADLATTGYKPIDYTVSYFDTGSHLHNVSGSGSWQGDAGAITAWRLRASSGNISGTCNLFQLGGS